VDIDDVAGMDQLKRWLQLRMHAQSQAGREFGLETPRGILLLGVPGAGKSLCAKSVASAWDRPLLRLDAGSLYNSYVGESERRLREALAQAEAMAPVILWIDEIEKAFASAASRSTDGGLSQRMFGALLTWMQEHVPPVFIVATANDIEALPSELLRKGRFDEIFFVDLPNAAVRRRIFEIHLARRNQDPKKFDLKFLGKISDGYSGAEIEEAIRAAVFTAFGEKAEVTTAGIEEAIRETRPLSVTMGEKVKALRRWAAERCRLA
jgi:SpoVK/Ycf46/Vps4 family AAA+-type ATPase